MTTFTTVNLDNLNPNRELYRMSGTRHMEVLWQPASGSIPEYTMMRVVDMGEPNAAATVLSTTQILRNDLPFNPKYWVIGAVGGNANGNNVSYTTDGVIYDSRPFYGAHVPMSATELLISYDNKMYRFTYDEGATGEIVYDGEVTQVGGTLPFLGRYGDTPESPSANNGVYTSEAGMIRMGTSNSFVVLRQPRKNWANSSPTTGDDLTLQIWQYNSGANTITMVHETIASYGSPESSYIIRHIPGSNDLLACSKYYYQNNEDDTGQNEIHSWNGTYRLSPDGTKTDLSLVYNRSNLYAKWPLPVSNTAVWWVGTSSAKYVDYANTANNKDVNYTTGVLDFIASNQLPNDGWGVSDTEFVVAHHDYEGRTEILAFKDTGFGFAEPSPNGMITIGSDITTADAFEKSEVIEFTNNQGWAKASNCLLPLDANTVQLDYKRNFIDATTSTLNHGRLYQHKIIRS